jgi:hypothetical protein
MPYIIAESHNASESATNTLPITLPITPAVDDVIYVCATNDGGGTDIAATGYDVLGTQAANGGSRQVWLRRISDGTETSLSVTGALDDWTYSVYVLRGVDVSGTPEVVSTRQDYANVRRQTSIAFDATAAGNHCLLLYSWGHDALAAEMWISPAQLEVDAMIYLNVGTCGHIVGHRTMHTAGNAPSVELVTSRLPTSAGGNGWIIAVKDAAASTTAPFCQYKYTDMLTILRMGGRPGQYFETDLDASVTFTATAVSSTGIWTATGWTPVNGTQIILRSFTGGGTNVLFTTTRYIVFDASGSDFKLTVSLSPSGAYGAAVALTANVTAATAVILSDWTAGRANAIASTINGIPTFDGCSAFAINGSISGSVSTGSDIFRTDHETSGAWCGHTLEYATPFDLSGDDRVFGLEWGTDTNWQTGRNLAEGAIIVFGDGTNWAAYQLSKKSAMTKNARRSAFIALGRSAAYDSFGTVNWASISKIGIYIHRGLSTTAPSLLFARCMCMIENGIVTGGCAASPVNAYALKNAFGFGFDHLWQNSGISQSIDQVSYRIGNGSDPTYWDASNSSQENPPAYSADSTQGNAWNVPSGDTKITIQASDNCLIDFSSCILAGKNAQGVVIGTTSSDSAEYSFAGATLSNKTLINDGHIDISNCTISKCPKVDGDGAVYTGVNFKASTDVTAALRLEDGGGAVDCVFTKGDEAYAVEIAGNGPATVDLTSSTFSGYAKPLNILGTTGTVTITLALGQAQPDYDTAGATVAWDQPTFDTIWTNTDLADGTSVLVRNIDTSTTIDYEVVSGGIGYTITLVPGVDYTVGDAIEIRQSRKDVKTYYQERTSVINTTAVGGSILEVDALPICPICTALDCDGEDYDTVFDLDTTDDELDLITDGTWQAGHLMCWWKWQMTLQAAMEQFWGAWSVESDGSFRNDVTILPSLIDTTETGDSVESTGRRIHRSDGARPIKSPTTGGGTVDLSWRDPVTVVATGSGVLPADITAIAAEVERSGGMLESVKTKTDNLPADPAGVSDLPGDPWAEVIDGMTAAQLMSVTAAALAGKTTGQPGAPVFRAINDSGPRIAATVDADGNRTSVTITP